MKHGTKAAILFGILALGAILALMSEVPLDRISGTGAPALLAFFAIIVTEVIIAPIPGGLISYVGAAHFGFWTAWPILYLGNLVGCFLSFALARHLGKPFVERVTSKKQRDRWHDLLVGKPQWLFLAYSVPVVPIDVISLTAGLTKVGFRRFALIVTPALLFYTGITAGVGATVGARIPFIEEIIGVVGGLFLVAFIVFVTGEIIRARKEHLARKNRAA